MKAFSISLLLATTLIAAAAPEEIGQASDGRIWLSVPPDSQPLEVTTTTATVATANWLKSPEKERLADITFPISNWKWTDATLTFTPAHDGLVTLTLLGPWARQNQPPRQEVLYDNLRIEGATLRNPDFEEAGEKDFATWKSDPIDFNKWPFADATPHTGARLASAWNNRSLSQSFQVKADQPVTISIMAKAASPPGMDEPKRLGDDTPAHHAAKLIKKGVNLGNCWEVPPPYSWKIPHTTEDIDRIAAEGFDHIRIPVAWHHHLLQENGKLTISGTLLGELEPVMKRALEKNLRILLDWHHYDALTSDPDAHRQRFVEGWTVIANHFKDWPQELWLELLNEPHDALTTARLNILHAETLSAIRRIDPQRIILVTPGEWGKIRELQNLRLPDDDDRIIVTIHNYDPFYFTHQGASWVGHDNLRGIIFPGPPESPLTIPESMKDNDALANFIDSYNTLPSDRNPSSQTAFVSLFETALEWSREFGRPIHLGEFGAITFADPDSRRNYIRAVRAFTEANAIPWTLWDWKAMFAYWDRKTDTPLLRDAIFE